MHVHADSTLSVQSLFRACLKEDGVVVPGSERVGHNVLTNFGAEWLAELLVWQTIGSTDAPFTRRRVRWIGVGDDSHTEVDESIQTLKSAVTIDGTLYLAEVEHSLSTPTGPEFVSPVWVRFTRTFDYGEISHSGDVLIKEAGLYADFLDGAYGLLPTNPLHPVIAYKTFDGLLKSSAFTLELEWSFKF